MEWLLTTDIFMTPHPSTYFSNLEAVATSLQLANTCAMEMPIFTPNVLSILCLLGLGHLKKYCLKIIVTTLHTF